MAKLQEHVKQLATMSPAQLRDEWQRVHRAEPPPGFGGDLLARSIAYTWQEKAYGGLPSAITREIRRAVTDLAASSLVPNRTPQLRPGTRLTREWNGRTHHVHVVDDGFEYAARHYRSLSAIAREITGAVWSGPRFFGLTSARELRRAQG